MFCKNKEKYLKEGRLEEVLALVQVLALDSAVSHRSENSLETILHSSPSSAKSWQKNIQNFLEFILGKAILFL
jgi:hypothetical protein